MSEACLALPRVLGLVIEVYASLRKPTSAGQGSSITGVPWTDLVCEKRTRQPSTASLECVQGLDTCLEGFLSPDLAPGWDDSA